MILKIFLFWRLGLFLITFLGTRSFPKIANSGLGAISQTKNFAYWTSWAQWDGGHFYTIAKSGYLSAQESVFFPLYPLLIKITGELTGNILLSGLLLSNLAFLFFLFFFFNFLKKKYSPQIAFCAVISFLVFPTSFFPVAFYSESLFLLLVVCSFIFIDKKNFFLASIFTSLAAATRLVGVFLVISLFYSYFSNINFNLKKIDRQFFYILFSFLGIIGYSLFLFFRFHQPFLFASSQIYWSRAVQDPFSTIFSYIWQIPTGAGKMPLNDFFDLAVTLVFLAILLINSKKIPSSLWIFSTLALLIPASTGTLTSIPRYALVSLGVFVIVGKLIEDKTKLKIFIWGISLFVQVILATLFLTGHWIA